jgi:hypothetical protein
MKKSIFVLLALISVSFITAQSKCEESFEFTSSELFERESKIPTHNEGLIKLTDLPDPYFFRDGSMLVPTRYDGTSFLLQYFGKDLKLIKESKVSFNKEYKKAYLYKVMKKGKHLYALVSLIQKKTKEIRVLKYDLNLNLISEKPLVEDLDLKLNGSFGWYPILAFYETPQYVKFFDDNKKIKINIINKKEVTTKIFDLDFNELNSFKYEDVKGVSFFNNLDSKGDLYSLYLTYNKKAKKFNTKLRKINTLGNVLVKDVTKELSPSLLSDYLFSKDKDAKRIPEIVNQTSSDTKYEIIYPLLSKTKQGFRNITIDKENLTIQLSEIITVKKKVSEPYDYLNYKSLLKDNNLYISAEVVKKLKFKEQSHLKYSSSVYYDVGNIYIYKINLENNKVEWESKINKLNKHADLGINKSRYYSFSWGFKNSNILMLLNSNNIINNKFSTIQKVNIFNEKKPSSLYGINLNTNDGTFCYKKIFENTNVILDVNEYNKNNPLTIIGSNKEKKLFQFIKL